MMIAVTAFAGSWEQALTLPQVFRHFYVKNRTPYRFLWLRDGRLQSRVVGRYVDWRACGTGVLRNHVRYSRLH